MWLYDGRINSVFCCIILLIFCVNRHWLWLPLFLFLTVSRFITLFCHCYVIVITRVCISPIISFLALFLPFVSSVLISIVPALSRSHYFDAICSSWAMLVWRLVCLGLGASSSENCVFIFVFAPADVFRLRRPVKICIINAFEEILSYSTCFAPCHAL